MATVQDIYTLVGALTSRARTQLKENHAIAAINEARFEVWKILTSFEAKDNWFVAIDTANTIAVDDLDIALPTNCGVLRHIEVTAPSSAKTVRFHKVEANDTRFQQLRSNRTLRSSEIPYTILGDEPGTLILGVSPEQALTVNFWIAAKPAEWTALSDNIDSFPRISWMPMARYAAQILMGGAGSQRAGMLRAELEAEMVRMTQASERNATGPEVVSGWME